MDDGHVIQGLGDQWHFAGARLTEWIAGFVSGILVMEFVYSGKSDGMPIVLGTMIFVTLSLSQLRRKYPDEERGLRNHVMSAVGVQPPGIPAPANLQPIWSGAPVRVLNPKSSFVELGLGDVFVRDSEEDLADEQFEARSNGFTR
jgi:hypothetical protein